MAPAPARITAALLLAALLATAAGCGSGGSSPISAFPVPGSRVVSPAAQIALRGLPAGQLGAIQVSGSRSGAHPGHLVADSDGHGASFLPAEPFTPGETVTVSTHLHVLGAPQGRFSFTVAVPAPPVQYAPLPAPARVPGDILDLKSRPDLSPAAVEVTQQSSHAAPGDIFIAPQTGPVQGGVMIVDSTGALVWYRKLTANTGAADFRVQQYRGNPVLTWWQGFIGNGVGVGEDVIFDRSYRQVAVVRAANGLHADLHEFQLTGRGTALITAYYPVYWDASSVHGPARQVVLDCAVQEIDIPTGLVEFQWDSLDHVPLTASQVPLVKGTPFDYFHVNAIDQDADGYLVVSSRNTWAAYKLSHAGAAQRRPLPGMGTAAVLHRVRPPRQHGVRRALRRR